MYIFKHDEWLHINYIIIKFMHIFSTKAFYWKHRLRFTAKVKNDNIWKRTEEKEKTEGKIERKKGKKRKECWQITSDFSQTIPQTISYLINCSYKEQHFCPSLTKHTQNIQHYSVCTNCSICSICTENIPRYTD